MEPGPPETREERWKKFIAHILEESKKPGGSYPPVFHPPFESEKNKERERRRFMQVIDLSMNYIPIPDILSLRLVSPWIQNGLDRIFEMDLNGCENYSIDFNCEPLVRPFKTSDQIVAFLRSMGSKATVINPFPGKAIAIMADSANYDEKLFKGALILLNQWGDQLWSLGLSLCESIDLPLICKILCSVPKLQRLTLHSEDENMTPHIPIRNQLAQIKFTNLKNLKSIFITWGSPWMGEVVSKLIQTCAEWLKRIHLDCQTISEYISLPNFVGDNDAMKPFRLPQLEYLVLTNLPHGMPLSIMKQWIMPKLAVLEISLDDDNNSCCAVSRIFAAINQFGSSLRDLFLSTDSECGYRVGLKKLKLPNVVRLQLSGIRLEVDSLHNMTSIQRVYIDWQRQPGEEDGDLDEYGEPMDTDEFFERIWKTSPTLKYFWVNGVELEKPDPLVESMPEDLFLMTCMLGGLLL